jgi:transposase
MRGRVPVPAAGRGPTDSPGLPVATRAAALPVLGRLTGVTGLKIIRAILAGVRNPEALAKLRDRRCQRAEPEIAQALDGRYRPEHLCELKSCLAMWDNYQDVIGELDTVIAAQLRVMRRESSLPPLPPRPRVRGRKPHDPKFDVRQAL